MNNLEIHLEDTIGVIEEILAGGGEFRMYPRGRSMRPLIVEKRDSVVLIQKPLADIRRHDMVFYRRRNGQFVLHRLMRIEKDGTYTMCGDAQTALEKGICGDQIIGCVSVLYRKERPVTERSFGYRLYVFLWCNLVLRRACMLGYRACRKLARVFHVKKGEN